MICAPADPHMITREDAASKGLKRFFTGIACRREHICERLVSNGLCIECAKIHKKTDRIKNAERERARSKRRIHKKRKDLRRRQYKPLDPAKRLGYQRKWKKRRSREQIDRENAWLALYRKLNPESRRSNDRNRAARKRNAVGRHSAADIRALYEKQNGKCACCLKRVPFHKKHVDHVMPLALGGGNGPENLQILCRSCNLSKSAKHPVEWARENGRLI